MPLRRLLLPILLIFAAPPPVTAQGLQIAQLHCQAVGAPIQGRVDVSLFQHGQMTGSTLMPWEQRRNMQALVLSGDISQIPGLLNYIGLLHHGANTIGFEVFLTHGTWGQGQYYVNGQAHRGTIMNLYMRPGGFHMADETGRRLDYRCQPLPGTPWAGGG